MSATDIRPEVSTVVLLARLSERTGVDCRHALPEMLLDELGFDSLARIEAVSMLEEAGIEVPEALAAELRTVGDLVALAEKTPTVPALGDVVGEARPGRGATSVQLVPLGPRHHEWAFELHTEVENLARYRTRAMTPSPDAFHQMLWHGVVSQFVVVAHGEPLGIVSLFDPDWRNGHAHLAVIATREWRGSGLVLEGLGQLIDWAFDQFPFRKLYFEALAGNVNAYLSGAGRRFEVEGTLRNHEFVDGGWEDLVVAAIYRDSWAGAPVYAG